MDETIKYCIHDVEECLKVLEYKISDFDSQLSLIEAFDLSFEMFNKTKAQLSAHILGAVKQHTFDDEFEITIPDTLQLSEKYQYIADWYKNPKNLSYKTPLYSYEKGHKRSLDTVVAGVPHTFAWGGVHGAIPNYKAEGIILCADVASLYPSIMIEYDCQSRKLMNPEKYKLIRDERLELKRKKDSRQQPYKIVLNSTYGILKDRNNPLYDPLMSNNVCVTGQLLLLDLIEKLEPYGKLIQSNTDGIYMLVDTMETVDKIKTVASEWEKRTRLDLEWDIYNKIYQKDVNNYIIIDSNGHHKAKGAYVKELSSIDYDLPIINTALIRYFVNNTPIEDTVNSCSNLIEFQKVVKLTALYKGVIYGEGIKEKQEDGTIKTKVKDGKMLREKVHRVFASKNEHAKGIYKIKTEKGKEVYEKMTNTPERCFIDNDDMTGKTIPEELDKEYYISLANERLSQFLEVSEEVINEVPEILYNILISSNSFYDFLKKCDKNDKTKVKLKYFRDYIIADCCNVFGKTKKLLDFIEYYLLLNNKSSITKASLDKKVICDKIKTIILVHSELNKTGKTYTIDSETILYEIFECLSNDSIHLSEILEKQVELFEEVRYVDSTLEDNIYYVLNTRNEIAPNVILYRLKDGVIENRKIDKQSFLILSLQDGDIIKVNSSELRYGQKAVGKNSDGTNIVENDITREFDVILNYDVLYRNYNKSNTLLSEED